jgi:FtsH-binding integral membrane protein
VFSWNSNDSSRYNARDGQRDQGGYDWDLRATDTRQMARVQEGSLTASFVWMFLALLVSAATAFLTVASPDTLDFVANYALVFIIAELALVVILSAAINRMSPAVAVLMLFAYAALTGATFAMILEVFDLGSVTVAFVGAAGIFGAAALCGLVTGRDLTSLGGILFAGLIGIVIASLANIFVGGDELSFIIGIVGVVLFTGLTAYDVQRIKDGRMAYVQNPESASVLGALALYLDFVNIFEMLLRLTGSQRR